LGEKKSAVIAAIAGNVAIAISKLVAAAFSGSSAMLSEAIHSLVDTGNGALLLFGMRRSRKPADEMHPFGHGHELYFWSLMVGMLVFVLGGGISIVNGWRHVIDPVDLGDTPWSYAVLGVAALFEGTSWIFGWRAFRKESRGRGIVETIVRTKDPTTFAVVLEDTAALLGLLFAFLGIWAGRAFGMPWLDGAASFAIGVLLCAVAAVMVNESRKLLVGEGVERATLADLRALIRADPAVEEVGHLLTMYLGPDEIMLVIGIRFRPGTTLDIRSGAARLKEEIQAKYPRIHRVYLEADSIRQ
jgi:cation diffusion facilitator family transporter